MILHVGISRRSLTDDEYVVVSTRTHVKALLLPAFLLIVLAAVAGFLSSFPTGAARPLLVAVISLGALAVAVPWVVRPFLRWLTTTFTVTNHRLVIRSGILTRRGRDIPLLRIADVSYESGLWDRLLGCGTLVVSDASENGEVELHDVPRVELFHLRLSDQVFGGGREGYHRPEADREAYRFDDGT